MSTCISEGSYNVLFIISIIGGLIFILGSAFYYDRFTKISTKTLTDEQISTARNATFLFMILATLIVLTLFVAYFGFQKRVVSVTVTH